MSTPPFTEAQVEIYLWRPSRCPYCGGNRTESGSIDADLNWGRSVVLCMKCDRSWEEIWKLVSIEPIDDGM